jgi:hypothetical protein
MVRSAHHSCAPNSIECIDLYLFTQGRGEVNWREGRGGAIVYMRGRKYHHIGLHLQSINY